MSELIQDKYHRNSIRWRLLSGVSAVALTGYIASADIARAEVTDRPTVWVELGGQLSYLRNGQETFAPVLMDDRPSIFDSSQEFEKPSRSSFGGYGEISIQPEHSDWVLSAGVQYGRSRSNKYQLQQTNPEPFEKYVNGSANTANPIAERFAETAASNSEQHVILDFRVGKDVGLGLFGSKSITSVISAGVRFAQFSSRTNISLKSDPNWQFNYKYLNYPSYGFTNVKIVKSQPYRSNMAHFSAERSFHGVGPSLSWKASNSIAGNPETNEISFDWGVNAALLFGRQKTQTHHQTTAQYHDLQPGQFRTVPGSRVIRYQHPATPDHTRSRSVVVPNIGGFAGMSFRYANARVSFGYRADFFFGAMDGGIDSRKTYDRSFYGPYATVSIGLGG